MRPARRRRTHAMSRYSAVTEELIDKCQRYYQAGRDLARSLPGLSAVEAAFIATESLEADRLLRVSPEMILTKPFDAMNDWSLAALAEILFARARPTRRPFSLPKEERPWSRPSTRPPPVPCSGTKISMWMWPRSTG